MPPTRKRGSERLNNTIISLIIIAVAVLLLASVARDLNSESKFLLDFYSHDLALLIEAAQTAPGDMEINYPLEKGYEAILVPGAVVVRHLPSGNDDQESFHLLPGHDVQEGSGREGLRISKKDGTIAFQKTQTTRTSCPPASTLNKEDLRVTIQAGRAQSGSFLNQNHLELLVASTAYHLERQGIESAATPDLLLTISAAAASGEEDQVIIRRPRGDRTEEQDYAHLYCELADGFSKTGTKTTEELAQGTPYEAEIIISIREEEAKSFITDRDDRFAKVIAAALAKEGTP